MRKGGASSSDPELGVDRRFTGVVSGRRGRDVGRRRRIVVIAHRSSPPSTRYSRSSASTRSAENRSFSVGAISKRSSLPRSFLRRLAFFSFSTEAATRLANPAWSVLSLRA